MVTETTEAPTFGFFDGVAKILRSGDGNRGEPSVVELTMPHGATTPLHVQDEDENIRLLEGEVTFYVGDDLVRASAGDAFVAPEGVPHAYRVESKGGARWVVVSTPGRFESFVRAIGRPADDDSRGRRSVFGLREAVALTVAAAQNGIEIIGPPGMLPVKLSRPAGRRTAERSKLVEALLPRPALACA